MPFERLSALLSITEPDDLVLAARVGLSRKETMGHLHDLIDTVTRGLAGGSQIGDFALVPDIVREVMVGKRQELPLHTGHIAGLTRLLRESIGTLGARTPVAGQCFHCEGTGHGPPAVGAVADSRLRRLVVPDSALAVVLSAARLEQVQGAAPGGDQRESQ